MRQAFASEFAVLYVVSIAKHEDDMAQHTGTVAWFNSGKGYGFITRDNGPDLFVHYSSIQTEGYKKLEQGDVVEFEVELGSTGKEQAGNVTKQASKAFLLPYD